MPIIRIPIEFSVADTFATSVDFIVVRRLLDFQTGAHRVYAPYFSTNHSLVDFFHLDFNWPYKAVAVAGGSHWNMQLGRDRLNLGPGHTGNLLISNHLVYHDYLQFKTWFGPIRFSTALVGFPSPKELGVGTATVKALLTHRFDWTIIPQWRIAITEAMMYQDYLTDFRFINPMMIYHQYFMADKSNSLLTAETQIALFRGLSVYGQFAMDDVRFLDESTSIPNALGWQIGLEYAWFDQTGSYLVWAEHVHTDPYLYLRNGINYIVAVKLMNPEGGIQYVEEYLGYPLGGDAHVYAIGLEWDSLRAFKAFVRGEYSVDGAVDFNSTYPPTDPQAKTPTGIPETVVSGTIGSSVRIPAGSFGVKGSEFGFSGSLSYVWILNRDNVIQDPIYDVQCSLGVEYSL